MIKIESNNKITFVMTDIVEILLSFLDLILIKFLVYERSMLLKFGIFLMLCWVIYSQIKLYAFMKSYYK